MTPSLKRVAFYARVSSEQQAQQCTIASQVAELESRIVHDGHAIEAELRFLDDGHSGSTLQRPALERMRDQAYAGTFQRLYVHSPDRLSRNYAHQMLLMDELRRHGIEITFLNHAVPDSPEEEEPGEVPRRDPCADTQDIGKESVGDREQAEREVAWMACVLPARLVDRVP